MTKSIKDYFDPIEFSYYLTTAVMLFLSVPLYADDIEEIVVQASYRDTALNQSDGSILVIDEDRLDGEPMKHFEQLSFLIPNLNFSASDSRPRYFQIRGIGERSGYEGTPNSSVGFMIDDIDFSGQGGIATGFDLEQVEVHRGPQGSRMGANALAGMIYIRSKEPTDTFEGLTEVNLGSDGIASIGFAMGGPMQGNPAVKYSFSLRQDDSDGFRDNLYLKRDDTTGKDELTGRLKINWQANDTTVVDMLLLNVDADANSDMWAIDGSLNTLSDKPGVDSQDTNALGLKINHLADGYRFESLSSVTDSDIVVSYDADWSNPESSAPYIYDFFSETKRSRRSFNQEFRWLSNPADYNLDKRFEWVLGLYYLSLDERNDKMDLGIYSNPFSGRSPYVADSASTNNYDSENAALFASFDYLISSTTTLSLGLRWEDWQANYNDTYGEVFAPEDQMLGGKLSLLNEWSQHTNVYMSVGRGYKSGGFNLGTGLQGTTSDVNLMYDPEYLWNYEMGVNIRYPESNMSLDTVVFYSDRDNQQVLSSIQVDPNDPNTFLFLTQNAAAGENYGVEMNWTAIPTDGINLFASLGLLRTKVTKYGSQTDLEGRDQAHAPRTTYAVGIKWKPTNEVYVSLDVTGKSGFYYSDSHNNKSKSYALTNLVIGYQQDQWSYEFWARNIFDKYYSVRGFYFGNEPPSFPATLYQRQGDPRHMGVLVRYEF